MDIGKKQEVEAKKKKNAENGKLIYSRAKQYAKEYEEQVLVVLSDVFVFLFFCFTHEDVGSLTNR